MFIASTLSSFPHSLFHSIDLLMMQDVKSNPSRFLLAHCINFSPQFKCKTFKLPMYRYLSSKVLCFIVYLWIFINFLKKKSQTISLSFYLSQIMQKNKIVDRWHSIASHSKNESKWKMDCHQQQHIIFFTHSLTTNITRALFSLFLSHILTISTIWKFNLTTLDVNHQSIEWVRASNEKESLKVHDSHSLTCLHQHSIEFECGVRRQQSTVWWKEATAKPVKMLEKLCIK